MELVINTFGVSLNRDNEGFVISNADGRQRIPAEGIKKIANRMLFFVMYDIESNKVRTLVHKYLKRMGCTPIQRSIFLADAPVETYNRIKEDLAAVQEAYDNDDSILVVPLSTDYLKMMKIIGHKIELDVITHSKSTLFF